MSGTTVRGSSRIARMLPGTSLRLAPCENAHAARITKAGFTNSLGWTPKIQRREPFTSWPNSSATTMSAIRRV